MRKPRTLLLILLLSISIIGIAQANAASYNLNPGDQTTIKIPVSSGDKVQITFTATGDNSYSLISWIALPNSTIIDLGNVDNYSTSFTSNAAGTCELHLSNTGSSDTIIVALNYQVDHYILGLPQMTFALIIIAVLVTIIIAGYVILSKPY